MKTTLSVGDIKSRFHKKAAANRAKRAKKLAESTSPAAKIRRLEAHPIIQGFRERKRSRRPGRYTYFTICKNCDADISPQYPRLLGCPMEPRESVYYALRNEWVNEVVHLCHACGKDPRANGRVTVTTTVCPDYDEVYSMEFPMDDPNFVPGKGVPMNHSRAREYAKRYGMEIM